MDGQIFAEPNSTMSSPSGVDTARSQWSRHSTVQNVGRRSLFHTGGDGPLVLATGGSYRPIPCGPPTYKRHATRADACPRHADRVAEDAVNGTLSDGVARFTLYLPTTVAAAGITRLLVRTSGDATVALRSIAATIEAAHLAASIQIAPAKSAPRCKCGRSTRSRRSPSLRP